MLGLAALSFFRGADSESVPAEEEVRLELRERIRSGLL